ncbi:MAG: short-chain dehydrogenase [Halioglobus sp.]|nr:short-chain dehydrogenase [Halioglobus sp.]
MESFDNRIAVITGGGSGIGRALVTQLAQAGCHVAFCDLSEEGMQGTLDLCAGPISEGVRVTAHRCDVTSESELQRLRDEVAQQHATDHIHLLFNNAGISGGQSFINDPREQWDRTFAICWGGVYLGCRVFLDMVVAAPEARIINTSSVNGFWACLGAHTEHSAYSTAKFAVKGFSESLLVDMRCNAPHVGVSVVMPGHIGTPIAKNTQLMWMGEPEDMDDAAVAGLRERWARIEPAAADMSDDMVRQMAMTGAEQFEQEAPTSADEAARIILAGVREGRWRILVGEDAVGLDAAVRANPEGAYEADFEHPFALGANEQAQGR